MPNADTEAHLTPFLYAILDHGFTLWSDTGCGSGRPAGQSMTQECHSEVIYHLVASALRGHTLEEAADQWEMFMPGTVRLDEKPAVPRRRGPDGRPLGQ